MKRKVLVFTISFLLICSVVVCFSFLLQSVIRKRRNNEDISRRIHTYRYLTMDSTSRTTTRGVVSLPMKIDDYVTFEPKLGIQTMISKFGSDEYFCSGSCICELDSERRIATSVVAKRGLMYLASAVSSVLAIKKAEEYFSRECEDGMKDECPLIAIRSEVDGCGTVDSTVSDESDEEVSSHEKKTTRKPRTTDFLCSGRCSASNFQLPDIADEEFANSKEIQRIRLSFKSEREEDMILAAIMTGLATYKRNVIFYCNHLETSQKVTVKRTPDFDSQESEAIKIFQTNHLQQYCRSKSMFSSSGLKDSFSDGMMIFNDDRIEHYFDTVFSFFDEKVGLSKEREVCKAGVEYTIPDETVTFHLKVPAIVCRRVFTDEEWEERIPHEIKNLKHWKEGWMSEPRVLTDKDVWGNTMVDAITQNHYIPDE